MSRSERKGTARLPLLCVRVIAAGLVGVASACADSEPTEAEPSTPDPTQMAPAGDESEAKLEVTVDGRSEPMQGLARLVVIEGSQQVRLTITGNDDVDNLVFIDLAFDGVDTVMGAHTVQLGPPEAEGPFAVGSFEGQLYHSPSGQVELSLSRDRSIEGSFEVELVQTSPAEAATPIDAMSGAFTGSWIVYCQSPIRGFTGGHSVTDSPYCNNLEL